LYIAPVYERCLTVAPAGIYSEHNKNHCQVFYQLNFLIKEGYSYLTNVKNEEKTHHETTSSHCFVRFVCGCVALRRTTSTTNHRFFQSEPNVDYQGQRPC
jgi:hypothetical protein